MKLVKNAYRKFKNKAEAAEWGKEHYGYWLPKLQNQFNDAQTPAEKFFRKYTQGIHYKYSEALRCSSITTYDFTDSPITKDEIIEGTAEINRNLLSENILVYRYILPVILKKMKQWSNVKLIRKNSILTDRGFLSTTLSLDSVTKRGYAQNENSFTFKIYVPKDTPCVYVGLVAGMNENEMLFAPGIKLKVIANHWINRCIECVVVHD